MGRAALGASVCAFIGCFSPDIPEGLVCESRGECPLAMVCDIDGRCRNSPLPPGDVPPEQAAPESPGFATTCQDWEPEHFHACSLPEPVAPLFIDERLEFNTTARAFMGADGLAVPPLVHVGGVLIMSVTDVLVTQRGRLRVTGHLPLVLAASGDIYVHGVLDASSTREGGTGAGANPAHCDGGPNLSGGDALAARGGGGGGGNQGGGGRGGLNDSVGVAQGGASYDDHVSLPLGGCWGGSSAADGVVSRGGAGGGAVQLTAGRSIVVEGTVHAGGAGGDGTQCKETTCTGAGGGGAGGYVGLDAPRIALRGAVLAANGGAGGAGGRDVWDFEGEPGEDGAPLGRSALGEHNGGDGGYIGRLAGQPGSGEAGGVGNGGGGGGAGWVLVYGEVDESGDVVVSPRPTFQ